MAGELQYTCITNCAFGLEDLVCSEITGFGGKQVKKGPGVVSWCGSLENIYKACLWSRFSSRILLQISSFHIADENELYLKVKEQKWGDHFDNSKTFLVSSTFGNKPLLTNSHYMTLRVKDGIVDSFRERSNLRPDVSKRRPDCKVHVHLDESLVSLFIDMSGEGLHRRGYRGDTGIAPLKENLGAAMVALSGWSGSGSSEWCFLDPMCGSGTLAIEAALMWGDTAPGLSRKYYGFKGWLGHDEKIWSQLVDEAIEREERALGKRWPRIIGFDSDPEMVGIARQNVKRAGLEGKIEIECKELAFLQPPSNQGYVVSNLPYGERLSDKKKVGYLYRCLRRKLQNTFPSWRVGLLISEADLADHLGVTSFRSYRLNNGPIRCRLYTGSLEQNALTSFKWQICSTHRQSDTVEFTNRLKKNYKKLSKWSRQNGVSCFRVYDRDLPNYNLSVDIYEKWILVQEYAAPSTIDQTVAKERFFSALADVRHFFGVKKDRVFVKRRERHRGKSQYQKSGKKPKFHEVSEGDCHFLVNFSSYLDTGLFLDHRPIRKLISQQVRGKSFLNLFGYTGAATIHAARGGAARTTTVDLSKNYLDWAENNILLNGFDLDKHRFIHQDCISWAKQDDGLYDVVFIDPPTFSNTKKKSLTFDVQRDHSFLLKVAGRLLKKSGVLYFSTNFRKFKLDENLHKLYSITDITRDTIPLDFKRSGPIHKCWQIHRCD